MVMCFEEKKEKIEVSIPTVKTNLVLITILHRNSIHEHENEMEIYSSSMFDLNIHTQGTWEGKLSQYQFFAFSHP